MQDLSNEFFQQTSTIDRLFKSTICSCEWFKLLYSTHESNNLKDRYRELMRVSRMWRDMIARVNSGLGHKAEEQLQPGGLAIFCPACPQPDINLPEGWDHDPKRYVLLLNL